ncbi:CoA transferase [Amycolatopsis sp. NPDC059657]|uniref:CoA transferase n=1 Tax=Amycolatopsis sp. NPDC059657 TaxID=3346899 RepID=UPI00366C9485
MITGSESVLPGPFRVARAAALSIEAATDAAGELLRLRGIAPGEVTVDTRHAAAAFHSEAYLLKAFSPDGGDIWAPLSGNYQARDGWVRLHCNHPQHADAVCWALGVPPTVQAVTAAVAKRSAHDVQEAVIAAGGAAALMRSAEEWAAHPQGQAVSELPLTGNDVIGDGPKRELWESDRPLGGIRVLDLTHVIAGPVAGRVLAAHGANVLHLGAAHLPAVAPLVMDTGMGKKSAYLNLTTEAGRAKLWKMIGRADVLLQSFRPGALPRLGFTPEKLAAVRPGLIIADLSAYGWTGPWARRRGFDSLVQLATGIAAEQGMDEPRPLPVQALDHATGWLAAAGIMEAVRAQVAEGGTRHVRVALARTASWLDSLGRKDPAGEMPDVSDLLEKVDSQFGELTRVKMPGELPGGNPFWTHASHLPGSDPLSW